MGSARRHNLLRVTRGVEQQVSGEGKVWESCYRDKEQESTRREEKQGQGSESSCGWSLYICKGVSQHNAMQQNSVARWRK